ncbi:MAG: epoxide hydrolase [Hyphomicrobiaceae bacterium]
MTTAPLARPFKISVSDAVLTDLHQRIRNTRWVPPLPNADWAQGTDANYLRSLLSYWAETYDWRSREAKLNSFDQFMVDVEGTGIHVVHCKAAGGSGVPLILTHGWPGSFIEYLPVIPLLTDPASHGIAGRAFDVVVPSLPGYGFSARPTSAPVDYRHVARLWTKLMSALGYDRFGAGGGDFGSGVSTYLALEYPERLLGLYLSYLEVSPYCGPGSRPMTDAERIYRETKSGWNHLEHGYLHIQSTKPQTLGIGLNDSPAGLASWIVEKWHSWGDTGGDVDRRFGRDTLLDNIMIYWVTQSITSSMLDYTDNRPYFDGIAGLAIGPDDFVGVPTGISNWPFGLGSTGSAGRVTNPVPIEWPKRLYNVVHWSDMPSGGHFAATEEPMLYARDIARFFGGLLA